MKRTVVALAGVASLAVGCYLGSRLSAQTGTAPAAAPVVQSKVAVINLNQVIRGYKKTTAYEQEFKGHATRFDAQLKPLVEALEKMQGDYKKALTAADKEKLEPTLKQYQRQHDDSRAEMLKFLKAKEDEQITILFRDVEAMVSVLAKSRGIELVMHQNDAVNQADLYTAMNISQKMTTRALLPIYAAPGLDISDEVIRSLNWNYDQQMNKAGTVTPTGGTAPAGGVAPIK